MKEVFSKMHRLSKALLITGWSIVVFMLVLSTVLYVGAGDMFDYYSSIEISEGLLAMVRPVCVLVCAGCISLEYYLKQKV